ncbi:MAG: hypothetical protein QOE30_953 [Mycobacterium sp.]|uniref:hypothetical protein n=1 Tax=Mycobacterium sp. TaxID=1785 RepID=UPI0028B8AE8C|nr:hypothetical protein [Mycobacterium sp.]MDT5115214.1 hypothetical protein [Mycobacterium sp.]
MRTSVGLRRFVGVPVTVNPGVPHLGDEIKTALVSLYTDDKLKLAAVIGMDLALTVYAGAAIGLPPPAVQRSV